MAATVQLKDLEVAPSNLLKFIRCKCKLTSIKSMQYKYLLVSKKMDYDVYRRVEVAMEQIVGTKNRYSLMLTLKTNMKILMT